MSNLITSYPRLNIDEIRKALPFVEKKNCTFIFNANTPKEFSVLMFSTGEKLIVRYFLTKKFTYYIELKKQSCNFGKFRYWLKCPEIGCGKPVRNLYLKNELFACRNCHKLIYRCQKIKAGFPLYRLERIEKLLQSKWGKNGAPPKRPKGMHQKTYDRLCAEYICTLLEIKKQGDDNIIRRGKQLRERSKLTGV